MLASETWRMVDDEAEVASTQKIIRGDDRPADRNWVAIPPHVRAGDAGAVDSIVAFQVAGPSRGRSLVTRHGKPPAFAHFGGVHHSFARIQASVRARTGYSKSEAENIVRLRDTQELVDFIDRFRVWANAKLTNDIVVLPCGVVSFS